MIRHEMKLLNGNEIAQFVKERQAKQVRSLKQSRSTHPKLAIVKVIDDPIIDMYIGLKQAYGEDIGVDVVVHKVEQSNAIKQIEELNGDDSIHGIIVQLPVEDNTQQDEILNAVDVSKDIDGLSDNSEFEPATPMAITWLLDGYNIELVGKKVALVGRGRLVGAPLQKLLESQGVDVDVFEKGVGELETLSSYDVVISATGEAGLIDSSMLGEGAIAVDAGVATEGYKTVGDFDDSVYARDDLKVTPKKGGVGPLTVCALFENLLRAAS